MIRAGKNQQQAVWQGNHEVARPLVHCYVLLQIAFAHSAKGTQEIARSCPDPLNGIVMNLADAIAVIISCPLVLAVIDA